jgi:hypothetical protein
VLAAHDAAVAAMVRWIDAHSHSHEALADVLQPLRVPAIDRTIARPDLGSSL